MGAITYLLQVSGCMAIFYLFYYSLLNRLTFFTINRYYLVITLVLSFVIPALTIPVHEPAHTVAQTVFNNNSIKTLPIHSFVAPAKVAVETNPPINWLQILKVGYLLIAAGLFVRLLFTLTAFFVRLKHKTAKRVGHIHILQGNKKLTNGSFFNYIFLNDDELSPAEMQQVIAHEMLHVKLFHSADRVLAKMVQIILWFNPVAYFYVRSIEENHEFEVDREIARSTDKNGYADLLLHLSVAANGMLYNNFSTVPLKKRITMLFHKPSAKAKKLVYVLAIPLLLLSCMAFATFKNIQDITTIKKLIKPLTEKIIPTANSNELVNKTTVEDRPVTLNTPVDIKKTQALNDTIKQFSVIRGVETLGKNPLVVIDGKEYPSDVLYKISKSCIIGTGIFGSERAIKKYGQKGIDGCVEIRTRTGQIIYASKYELENLAAEASVQKSQIITRITLKKDDGSLYDKIIEQHEGSRTTIEIAHNAKVAFFIDSSFYSEEEIKKVLPQRLASLKGFAGTQDLDVKKMPDNNLHGYESVFFFWSNPMSEKEEKEKTNYSWEKLIPIK